MTVTVGRGTTSQQRRESAAERFSVMSAVLDAFDADVAARPPTDIGALDGSRLRRVVRALLPLALDDPTFDVTSTIGDSGVAVRVHHCADRGLTARIVTGPPGPQRRPADAEPTDPAGSHVVGELAELLRRRQIRPR